MGEFKAIADALTCRELGTAIKKEAQLYQEHVFHDEDVCQDYEGCCDVHGLVFWLVGDAKRGRKPLADVFSEKPKDEQRRALAAAVVLAFQAANRLGFDLSEDIVAFHNGRSQGENCLPDDLRVPLVGWGRLA